MTSGAPERSELNVAVGVLQDPAGKVLISQRPATGPHPGAWEFPGGKLAVNETPLQALQRELDEELAIRVRYIRYLADLQHDYVDEQFSVHLICWKVLHWEGQVKAAENQAIQWIEPERLMQHGLLEADRLLVDLLTGEAAVNVRPFQQVAQQLDR